MQINPRNAQRASVPHASPAPPRPMMPSSAVRTFTDPDTYFAGIRNLKIEGVVTKRGEFRAKSTRIDLHRLQIHRFDKNLPRIMTVTPSGSRTLLLLATDPAKPAMLANGFETSQHQIANFGLRWPYHLLSSGACGWATMSLTPEDLTTAGITIIGRELTPPTFMHLINPPMPAVSRLLKLHEAADHLAKTTPDILANPEVARAIEQALVEAMILCLAGSYSENMPKVRPHRGTIIGRLEEALEAKSEEPLYMAELCAAVGASYWTLRNSCLEYLGMSPKRYLWLRRMNLVRRALQSANEEGTTVTEIATNCGFWELGRFSVAYHSLFGESPSTALRRRSDTPNPGKGQGRGLRFTKSA